MRNRFDGRVTERLGVVVGMFLLAVSLQGQQPQKLQGGQPADAQARSQQALIEIYQIDLDPTGSAFALGKPKLEGGVYVYLAWPEKDVVRLPQVRVKKITQRTKDLNKETVYQIDLLPTGRLLTREKPKLKSGSYVFNEYKNGDLMSLRQSDVKKVTLLTGIPAFRAQQEEMGAALIGNLPMEGGGSVQIISPPATAAAPQSPAPAPGNWTYEGTPGTSDAYGPANATVDSPGDVPKAPTPPAD